MNCENIPILDGDPDDPLYLTIPPPPLHTILLGPVNHVFKELRKRHPVIMKTIKTFMFSNQSTKERILKVINVEQFLNLFISLTFPKNL